jgi:hypothetical protein
MRWYINSTPNKFTQTFNSTVGAIFQTNATGTISPIIHLIYPFTSFILNYSNNPNVQNTITIQPLQFIVSNTLPAAPVTRKIAQFGNFRALNASPLSNASVSFSALLFFNNYSFSKATSFSVPGNTISLYMSQSNYQNPVLSMSNITVTGQVPNFYKAYNNFCPVLINSSRFGTFNQYYVDSSGQDVQYSVLQGSGYGAINYYMILQTEYNTTFTQVGSYKITSSSPFVYPTEIQNPYKFIFLTPGCKSVAYSTPSSLVANPYTITIPIIANVSILPAFNVSANCTTKNATAIRCYSQGFTPNINFYKIYVYNQAGAFAVQDTLLKNLTINGASFNTTITGLNTSNRLEVIVYVNFGDPANTTLTTYFTQFMLQKLNFYGLMGPIAAILVLALIGIFVESKALPFIGAPLILLVLWAFNIINLTFAYIITFIVVGVIFIVIYERDYK